MTAPSDYSRRSFVYPILQGAGASFSELSFGGSDRAAIPVSFGASVEEELAQARSLALADLSPLPRTGFKGADTRSWLAGQDIELPSEPNRATRQADGTLVARLSQDEHLVLPDPVTLGDTCARLDRAWSLEVGRCYHMPRRDSHFWYIVSGSHASAMLAKLCGVDLRTAKLSDGRIAQTSLARINAIVLRGDVGRTPAFHLLADSAYADYLWPCLLDAMDEFGGKPVGLLALSALSR